MRPLQPAKRGPVDPESARALHEHESSVKRRKGRKSTRSCWECRRRKTKCSFASPQDSACAGCQRWHTPCIGQHLPEDLSPPISGSRHLGDRIARVESVIKDLLENRHAEPMSHEKLEQFRDNVSVDSETGQDDGLNSDLGYSVAAAESLPAPDAVSASPFLMMEVHEDSQQANVQKAYLDRLFAALPAAEDVRLLLKESAKFYVHVDICHFQPFEKFTLETLSPPYPELTLPDRNCHPTKVAYLMLILALSLQRPGGGKPFGVSEPGRVIIHRLLAAVRTCVTSKDEMLASVDGLMCLLIEAIIKMNYGCLRQAWTMIRKALSMAQMMGLHRNPVPPLRYIDVKCDTDPKMMWLRIVALDRSLSLLLGLPQGTSDSVMPAPSILQQEPPIGVFERQLINLAGNILQRNEKPFSTSEYENTKILDAELLRVSGSMPASFWRRPDFGQLEPGSADYMFELKIVFLHVWYYGLLIQVHLPFAMHGNSRRRNSKEHEYSQFTSVNAGRETLNRFIAHRTSSPTACISRPVDFYALLASMTVLLAHLYCHFEPSPTNILSHQRLSDRAMLEQVLERMDIVAHANNDAVSKKSASLIRYLLDIETDAAKGRAYTITRDKGKAEHEPETMECTDGGLALPIPYLGVIRIARRASSSAQESSASGVSQQQTQQQHSSNSDFLTAETPSTNPAAESTIDQRPWPLANQQQQNPLPGHDVPQDPTLADVQPHANLNSTQPRGIEFLEPSMLQYPNFDQAGPYQYGHMELPTMTACVDDWAFQGVDMAFFENLMRGVPTTDTADFNQA